MAIDPTLFVAVRNMWVTFRFVISRNELEFESKKVLTVVFREVLGYEWIRLTILHHADAPQSLPSDLDKMISWQLS